MNVLLNPRDLNSIVDIISMTCIIWSEAIAIITVMDTYIYACSKANTFGSSIHNVQNKLNMKSLKNQVECYSIRMIHEQLSFNVFQLFSMDRSILYAGTGTVLSILFMLVDYDRRNNRNIETIA
ncbi:hypothetical protein RN001_001572 [Aquatica leii]|uniref:Gustatory receptor n=1 Tax=Aquatica leii TaxID=1421715 RepID=A0AAN7SCT2_9COLE|nr:hypothetical protein RN001_001572 [Aquatica leii]